MSDVVLPPSPAPSEPLPPEPSGPSGHATVEHPASGEVLRVMRRAWIRWVTLLIIPFVLFMSLMVYLSLDPVKKPAVARAYFILSVAWIGAVVPATFFLRAKTFKAYWQGGVVAPRDYLRGMTTIWISIEIGGLIALVGCFLSNSMTPNVLPAVVAFMLYMPFWPSGEAMTKPLGDEDDPEVFRHPR